MLNFMRRFATTWFGKILGAFLLVGLAGFGISNVVLDLGSNTIAQIGDENVTTVDFQRAYQQQLQSFSQQTGQMPTNEQAIQMGIPTSVLNQLATRAAINEFAVRQGVGVSNTKLSDLVRSDSSFFGVLGSFDRSVYEQVLRQQGITDEQYFDIQRKASRRQQVAIGMFAGSQISKTGIELLNRYRNDLRTVEYFTLNGTSLPTPAAPTDADLTAYLTEHQAQFRTVETRTADVLLLTQDTLAALPEYQPADADVQAEYDRTKDQLVKIEKRHILQVALPDAAAEKTFTDQLAAGTDFATALAASGLKAADIGELAKAEVSDPALADAAFSLARVGDFVIIPGIGGKRVVTVTEIKAGGQVTFEEAKADIVKRLSTEKAKTAYPDLQDQIEELRAAFKPLKEIADRFKLTLTTVTLSAAGTELSAVNGLSEENRAKAAKAIFAGDVGKLSATVAYGATNNLWFDLSKIDAARDQTLDEVRDAVTTAYTNAKTDEALLAEVKDITAELDGGKAFQDIAAARSQFATISAPFTRDGDGTTILNKAVATAVFSAGPDTHGWAVNGDGDYLVYHVTDVTPPTSAASKDIVDFLEGATRDGLYADFIAGVTDELWPQSARGGAYQRMLTLLATLTP